MRTQKKKFKRPLKTWESERINAEKQLTKKYGLKNKKEIWRAESLVKKIRTQAKSLITAEAGKQEEFFDKLKRKGLIKGGSVEEILGLEKENIFERRLQTIVSRKFNIPIKLARQAIVHGKVKVGGRNINSPSYSVDIETEPLISCGVKAPVLEKKPLQKK